MRYLLRLLIVAVFMSSITLTGLAESGNAITVSLPVSGKLLMNYGNGKSILMVDTFNGTVQPLVDDGSPVYYPIFSPPGDKIAYFSNVGNDPENRHNVILDIATGERETVGALDECQELTRPIRWSQTTNSLLYYTPEITLGELTKYRFEELNLTTGEITLLHRFSNLETLSGFDLPFEASAIYIDKILRVIPNPTYDPWIALAVSEINTTIVSDLSSYPYPDEAFIDDVILWNYETQEMISVGAVLDKQIDTSDVIAWSPDGRQLMISNIYDRRTSKTTQYMFTQLNGIWSLLQIKEAEVEPNIIFWLGVQDLTVALKIDPQTQDTVYDLGQIVDNEWHSTEFLRFSAADFPQVVNSTDWRLLASEEEKHTLSCIFDETLPVQLEVGARGWIAIVDGIPRNLQTEPGTGTEIIAQMPEGTAFEVIGAPWCSDGQRWWQIQLSDGTVGYAAEANTDTYFLEPLPSDD